MVWISVPLKFICKSLVLRVVLFESAVDLVKGPYVTGGMHLEGIVEPWSLCLSLL